MTHWTGIFSHSGIRWELDTGSYWPAAELWWEKEKGRGDEEGGRSVKWIGQIGSCLLWPIYQELIDSWS